MAPYWVLSKDIMSKTKKLIRALKLILNKPYLLNKVLDDNDNWKTKVVSDYNISEGFDEISFRNLAAGKEIAVKPFAFMEGGSLPTDLALLRILASSFKDCNYFEIGTWRGESVANVAEVARACTSLNLPVKTMKDAGLDPPYIDQHAMFSHGLKNVLHMEGNSLEYDFAGLHKKYDLIFIDGDHHYDSIRQDTKNVFDHLVHEKSIVVWHDYAWQPGNIRYETMAAILAGVPMSLRKNLYAVRNTLCALYYPAKINAHPPSTIAIKEEAFEVKIK